MKESPCAAAKTRRGQKKKRNIQKPQCLNLGCVIGSLLPYYIDQLCYNVGGNCTRTWLLKMRAIGGYFRARLWLSETLWGICWNIQAWVGADHDFPGIVISIYGSASSTSFWHHLRTLLPQQTSPYFTGPSSRGDGHHALRLAPSCLPCVYDPHLAMSPKAGGLDLFMGACTQETPSLPKIVVKHTPTS